MLGSGVSVRLASARVVYTVHWSTESCDMARSTHVGGRSYYANLLLTHPGWGHLYSACGRSMDVHLRHQAAQLRTWDVSILWTIRRPRSDRNVHLPPRRRGRHQCMRTFPLAPSQAWKSPPFGSLSTVHTPLADKYVASSAWKSLPLSDETVGGLPTVQRPPQQMSMATSGWKRPHIELHERRPSQGHGALSTGQSSIAWKMPDF